MLPTTQRHGMGTLTYSPLGGGWLSGRWRKERRRYPDLRCPPERTVRHDHAGPTSASSTSSKTSPSSPNKPGMTLIELAIAFVINHPGVTSAIVGPAHHGAARVLPACRRHHRSATEVLDRIDQLVAPGVTVNPDDNSYGDQELNPSARRR